VTHGGKPRSSDRKIRSESPLSPAPPLGYASPMRVVRGLVPLLLLLLAACGEREADEGAAAEAPTPEHPRVLSESSTCADCHAEATEAWTGSHHQLAHRDVGTEVEAEAFADREVTSGDARWTFEGGAESPQITWSDTAADSGSFERETPMVIGLTPLVQYLLNTGDGRYQVPDMAWDPEKKEWFSIYGDENRRPEEWGHWTQRGMNWNSQCAYCHFTGLEKNYDPEDDSYDTAWVEQGVGCAQCHGPDRPEFGQDECRIDPARQFTREQWLHSCATCHSRRSEFDEEFTIGDSFHDHYHLSLPDQPGLWHPDGQQLDEVYKFTSLMLSRMGHKGITCTDCHDPHAAEPHGGELAVRSNALCMTCHAAGANEAVVIDPAQHVFHEPGTPGASCVDCHMPKKSYMQRDPRSDHRFPRPDPLLTKELGTPNACNDCHADQGLDWQIEWTHKWYGEDMNAASRLRSRAIDAAQNRRTGALDQLLAAYAAEEIDAWKATLLRLMEPWADDSRVVDHTNVAVHQGGPLARTAAAMLVPRRGDTGPLLDKLLDDPIKAVRVEAAWNALDAIPLEHPAVAEVEAVARHQSDQPGGAMRMARLAMRRGDTAEAEKWFERAVAWDATSPAPRRDFAVFLSGLGRTGESMRWLEEAAKLSPNNAEIPYLIALAHAESGDTASTEARLRQALELDPSFSRAWYNLGLLQAGQGQPQAAIASLRRAADTDTASPDAPYARATIHLRLGQAAEALEAAHEALRRAPDHAPARQLVNELGRSR